MKKLILLAGYFAVFHVILLTLILYSLFILHENSHGVKKNIDLFTVNAQFQALPPVTHQTIITLYPSDGRIEVLKDFFKLYKSPLHPFAEHIVKVADKYNIDYRLLPAIAMQESNLCKKIPKESHNCWGFGIYGGKVIRFEGYNQAIETVAKTLAKEYVGRGLLQPNDIMKKYTPSSNGSWSNSVTYYMDEIHTSL